MYQETEKNKKPANRKMVMSVSVLLAFALAFSVLAVPEVIYAEEVTDTFQDPGPDIEIYIDVPEGYFNDKATVTFRLKPKTAQCQRSRM